MNKRIHFTKMHGAGNDYIYVYTPDFPIPDPSLASIEWSKQHFGIGSDGLILVGKSPVTEADFSMRIFNNDGSEALMCGNGVRCVAKFVYDHKLTSKTTVAIDTLSGIKVIRLHPDADGQVNSATVDMGTPVLSAQNLLSTPDGSSNEQAPSWTDPDKSVYPMSMTAVVRLSPILETLAADDDMMAAFIGGECRGVAKKVMNDGVRLFFIHVKAPSSENGNVEFRYYSAASKRVYVSVAADVKYEVDKIYGTAENPEYPDFEQSGPYPIATKAWVKVDKAQLPFAIGNGDELQAFVGDECRGIKHVENEADMLYWYDILGRAEGEKMTFRYYSAEKKQVYVSEQIFNILFSFIIF